MVREKIDPRPEGPKANALHHFVEIDIMEIY